MEKIDSVIKPPIRGGTYSGCIHCDPKVAIGFAVFNADDFAGGLVGKIGKKRIFS